MTLTLKRTFRYVGVQGAKVNSKEKRVQGINDFIHITLAKHQAQKAFKTKEEKIH